MTAAALWALAKPHLLWAAPLLLAPAAVLSAWAVFDWAADRRAETAAASARLTCDAIWRGREAAAHVRALEQSHEIRRRMDALRPDPDRVREQLEDGSF